MATIGERFITDINELDPNSTYTYNDYLTWRFDEHVELFKGKVMRMSPAPKRLHQRIAGRIFSEIELFLRRSPARFTFLPLMYA